MSPQKCPDCGQAVMPARALAFGEWVPRLFTARPAVVYTLEDNGEGWNAVRYRPDLKIYLYHEAVCPRRQLVTIPGSAQCRSCPASVTWVISPAGARLPIDARPLTVYTIDEQHLVLQAIEHIPPPTHEGARDPAPLFLSHFASCPNAGLHSKGKK